MNPYFSKLGRLVLEEWEQSHFSLELFPEITKAILERETPYRQFDLFAFQEEFLLNSQQPSQSTHGFGQPEIIVFDDPRFYIQLLFWMDGTTDIHQHAFSGAFHVLVGSSIHASYQYSESESTSPELRIGDIHMERIEVLETGRSLSINSGSKCIHSLFHLDTPSVTLVIRTHHDLQSGTQFNYLPPHIALAPEASSPLTLRRQQLLDVVFVSTPEKFLGVLIKMIKTLKLEEAFAILQSTQEQLRELGEWKTMRQTFEEHFPKFGSKVFKSLNESARRASVANLRHQINNQDHRFFLALLMNAPNRKYLLDLVAQRYNTREPLKLVLGWLCELLDASEDTTYLLDIAFPEELGIPLTEQAEMFLGALQKENKTFAARADEILYKTLLQSTLRPLLLYEGIS